MKNALIDSPPADVLDAALDALLVMNPGALQSDSAARTTAVHSHEYAFAARRIASYAQTAIEHGYRTDRATITRFLCGTDYDEYHEAALTTALTIASVENIDLANAARGTAAIGEGLAGLVMTRRAEVRDATPTIRLVSELKR